MGGLGSGRLVAKNRPALCQFRTTDRVRERLIAEARAQGRSLSMFLAEIVESVAGMPQEGEAK